MADSDLRDGRNATASPESDSVNCVNNVQGWDPPVEFSAPTHGPRFPLPALPSVLGNYVEQVAKTHKVPVDLPASLGIGTCAAVAAKHGLVKIGRTHTEPLNLYLAVVAPSGERKAAALRAMAGPLFELEKPQGAQREESNGRITAPPLGITVTDSTSEALVRKLAQNNGVAAWVSEEAGTLVDILTGVYKKNGPDLDVFLQAYDGGMIRVERVTTGSHSLDDPALTIVVTLQPTLLKRIGGDEDFRGRGLVARIAFVVPLSLVGTRYYEDIPIEEEVYNECRFRLLSGLI